jgi:hypothetical protein
MVGRKNKATWIGMFGRQTLTLAPIAGVRKRYDSITINCCQLTSVRRAPAVARPKCALERFVAQSRAILVGAGQIADALGLDDELLDGLLVRLGLDF